ncbi:T9SS type A sorting domain-containing protein [Portibacter marinus]|uniref:T9SS type A sorting domain-containing protein n=1 Tax=Portibacter marinus TaxID=2898660 RepID=UPI001F42129A|nr:T9SS type A sorting domain-containing protein [Portibacter marinus]
MNRSLRFNLNKHLKRAFASLALSIISICAFSQISNCPSEFVSLIVDDDDNCTAAFMTMPAIMASGTATFSSEGATVANDVAFSMLSGFPFEFGVSEVTIIDGLENCIFTVIVSNDAPTFTDLCSAVTVDLMGECTQEFFLPDDFPLAATSTCPAGNITFSFTDTDPSDNSITLDATMLGDINATIYINNGAEQGSCNKTITVEDSAPIMAAINCPGDATLAVAPSCMFVYNYAVDATIPCGGSLVQTAGDPSGTPLGAGMYTYTFEVRDANGSSQAVCSFNVNVEETAEAGAQVNCLAELNVSLDQTCEAIIGPSDFVTGQICSDIDLYTVSAIINGEEVSGPTITFTQDQIGQEIDVTVFDPNMVNSCWGTVTIEDKVAPIIACPDDLTVTCLEPTDTSATGLPMLLTAFPSDDEMIATATISNGSCVVDLFFDDVIQEFGCNGPFQRVITRTFYVIDNAGNRSESCSQTISVTRETLASATYPPHYDGIDDHPDLNDNGVGSEPPLSCDGQDITWNSIVNDQGRIVPSPYDSITPAGDTIPGTGAPGGVGTCGTIKFFFEDLVIDICNDDGCESYNPSYKVLRTFDIYDWCTGEAALHEQIIKVVDTIPPVFTTLVPDMTVSTDLWGCGATINLPVVEAMDNCSSDISYSWYILDGTYDAVLNKVYVPDNALTELGEEIELIVFATDCCGNTASDTGLVTIVDAVPPVIAADEHTTVSLNSLEDNGAVKVHVESFDDGSWDNCGPIDYWVRRMDRACENYDGLDENGNVDTSEVDEINDFHKTIHFCCEDVAEDQMVVFMVCDDADRDGIVEMNGDDNCNTSMIIVDVQDKLAPTIVCPNPVTINCIDFGIYQDYQGVELNEDQQELLNVRFGSAFTTSTCVLVTGQTFSGEELCGSGTAMRTFTAENSNGQASCNQTIFIEADEDNVLTCDRISFPTLSDAPYNYDWCDPFDTLSPFLNPIVINSCGDVEIEEPIINRDDLCTEVGINLTLDTFKFAEGGCLKILAHWEVIDECIFDENYFDDKGDLDPSNNEVDPFVAANGYFELYVEYDIFDSDPPVLTCDSILVETEDCLFNYDSFSIVATDACTPDDALGYGYKVDFNADGSYDYPVDSTASGSSFDANLVGGLPVGTHNVKWIVNDGCGNFKTCIQTIQVVQRIKAPTPYCHLGLSSAVMDEQFGCSVEFWAIDFIQDKSLGACGDPLTYLMIPYQDIFGDPADETDDLSVEEALEMAEASWDFGCEYIENGVQGVIEIRVYAVDGIGAYDFCDASLTLNDNFDCCVDQELGTTLISGNVMTENGVVMNDIELKVSGNSPELPKVIKTSDNGSYVFNNLKFNEDYKVSAYHNEKALKGVSTLDLVLIQRHILGMTELDSPYKLIAADINGNERISASDLLQLRKLILGLYPDDLFPSNLSWRFLDHGYKFVDPSNPFPFNESINISNLPHAMFNQNFVAVKIGDVNNSIQESAELSSVTREQRNYMLEIDNQIFDAGQYINIPVKAQKSNTIVGMQFALSIDKDIIASIDLEGGLLSLEENHVAIHDDELKVSWSQLNAIDIEEGDVLFTLNINTKKASRMTNALRLNPQTLKAELYNENLETEHLSLDFRTVEEASFALLQNEPNPFSDLTRISFVLPTDGQVNFKVFDISGKLLMNRNTPYTSGTHTITVNGNNLPSDGVMYYQLEFNGQQITKKMILIE